MTPDAPPDKPLLSLFFKVLAFCTIVAMTILLSFLSATMGLIGFGILIALAVTLGVWLSMTLWALYTLVIGAVVYLWVKKRIGTTAFINLVLILMLASFLVGAPSLFFNVFGI